jgi:Fe-S-cluster-containing hydrogenase component 2
VIVHYGYVDGSGEYFIVVDTDRCNGCEKCVQQCPQHALELVTEFIDLEDKTVVAVTEEHRKKILYTCAECNPAENMTPCIVACEKGAIRCIWKPL